MYYQNFLRLKFISYNVNFCFPVRSEQLFLKKKLPTIQSVSDFWLNLKKVCQSLNINPDNIFMRPNNSPKTLLVDQKNIQPTSFSTPNNNSATQKEATGKNETKSSKKLPKVAAKNSQPPQGVSSASSTSSSSSSSTENRGTKRQMNGPSSSSSKAQGKQAQPPPPPQAQNGQPLNNYNKLFRPADKNASEQGTFFLSLSLFIRF